MDSLASSDHEDSELACWEPEQAARFLEYVAADPLAALFEVAAYAGLRRAELRGLRWSDIDADGASLTVRQTVIELRTTATTIWCSAGRIGRRCGLGRCRRRSSGG